MKAIEVGVDGIIVSNHGSSGRSFSIFFLPIVIIPIMKVVDK